MKFGFKTFPVDSNGKISDCRTSLKATFFVFFFIKIRVGELRKSGATKNTNSLDSLKARPATKESVGASLHPYKDPLLSDSDDLLKALLNQNGGKIRIAQDAMKSLETNDKAVAVAYDDEGVTVRLIGLYGDPETLKRELTQ